MTTALPNPLQFESADSPPLAGQLTAHVDHAAVLLSRAKATEGKAGTAAVTGRVRRSTAGTGLRVGEADAVLPATSEVMDVTARRDEQPFFSYVTPSSMNSAQLVALPADVVAELEGGISAIVAGVARKSSHSAFRILASNSTFIPTT